MVTWRQRLLVVAEALLRPRLSWGKWTVGVRGVGPYRPRLRAAGDLRGCLTLGNGEKTTCWARGREGWGAASRGLGVLG